MEDLDCFDQNYEYGCNEIFGEHNDFIEWLFNVFGSNSILLLERFNHYNEARYCVMKLNETLDVDLTDMKYNEAYDYFDYVYEVPRKLSFKIKDVKYPDRPIYKVPLIKALYYSYKHMGK